MLTRIMAVLAIAYLVGESVFGPRSPTGVALALAGFLPMSTLAAWAFLQAGRVAEDRTARRGFTGYALSFALTAAGTLLTGLGHLGGDAPRLVPWAAALELASYPAAIVGVLSFRTGRSGSIARWRLVIDSTIAVIAALAVAWIYIVAPQSGAPRDPFAEIILYAYPIGDLVLFAALVPVLLAPRAPHAAGLMRMLATAQMIYLAGDMIYQLSPPKIAWLPFDWPDAFYLAGYVGLVWVAEGYRRSPIPALNAVPDEVLPAGRNWLPVALGGVIYLMLVRVALDPWQVPLGPLALTAVLVTLLILVRERLAERQAVALARALEAERNTTRFQAAIAHLKVGIAIVDRDGRFSLANPAAAALLHLDGPVEGAALHQPAWPLTTEDEKVVASDHHPAAVALATGHPVRDVMIGIRASGHLKRRWLLIDADPVRGGGGQVDEVVLSIHDITERRQLEEQLRHTQRMEAIGKLAGGVAHDFNNLLTAIIGHSDLLRTTFAPGDQRIDDVAAIRQAADRAAGLTRQLLAFSRRQRLMPETHDLNRVIRDTERLLHRLLGEDIAIVLNLDAEPIWVRVDRGQLDQVVVNLALNARDAMPRGGYLTIATRRAADRSVEMPADVIAGEQGIALLRITDVGEGMDEPTRARAFEPFFTTKEVGKGTGLGLATVYGIVQQSGGAVTIESEVGVGTSVSVYLPATEAAPAAAAPPASATPPAAPRDRASLVVEDDPMLGEVIRRTLTERGFRVLVAGGPSAARVILKSNAEIDLLLTDVVMPGGNGPELAAWARTIRPTLRVLLMTGHADDAILRYDLDPDDTDLIQKPFDSADLVTRIDANLSRPG